MPNAIRVIDDHGELSGLGDDDHTNYGLASVQAGGLAATLYQAPWVGASALSTGGVNVGQIHYQPFRIAERSVTLTALQFRVTALPTNPTKMLIAILPINRNFQPTAYAAQYAETTISATGSVELTSLATTLTEGMYAIGYQVNASLTLQCLRGGMYTSFVTSGFATMARTLQAAHVYGTWPVSPLHWTTVDTSTVGFEHPFLLRFN